MIPGLEQAAREQRTQEALGCLPGILIGIGVILFVIAIEQGIFFLYVVRMLKK